MTFTPQNGGNKAPRPPVIFLMGPTAAGKTQVAIELASQFPVEVISVDAAQVYKGMTIGTAKPSTDILRHTPHRLIDVCEPWERYSAGRFCADALVHINEIFANGKIPLLAGGTMFYFKALESGLSNLPGTTLETRSWLHQRMQDEGLDNLYCELMRVDPVSADGIVASDSQRILRMLELYYATGRRPSDMIQSNLPTPIPFDLYKFAIYYADRAKLQNLISERFNAMLRSGFLHEAETIYHHDYFDASLPAMRLAGYKQAWQYLSNDISYCEMTEKAIQSTCAIAKRQLTWLRNSSGIIWAANCQEGSAHPIHRLLKSILANQGF